MGRERAMVVLVVMASLWVSFGCESTSPVVGQCASGQAALCLCDDGALGSQHCGPDGAFDACQCAAQAECAPGDTALCLCPLDRAGQKECGQGGTYGICDCSGHFGFCVPGEVALCACPQGEEGVQACSPEGTFGACQCDGAGSDASACQEGEGAFCRCSDGSPGGQVCTEGSFGPCHCPEPSTECTPGASRTCYCSSGETGLQTCQEDGAYDACQCEPGVPRCTPGRSVACHCSDGSLGVQWCQADGVYGACACDEPGPDSGTFPEDAGSPDPCTPKTCEDLLAACGELRDGCGGAVWCGSCSVDSTRTVALSAGDLIYDHVRGLLYVTTPSTQGLIGNSVVAVDPASGQQQWDQFVGSEPRHMAMSDDGRYLYIWLSGSREIARFDLDTREVDLQFAVGTDNFGNPAEARQIAVLPGLPRTIAVLLGRVGSTFTDGVAMFDDGVRRPLDVSISCSIGAVVAATSNTVYASGRTSSQPFRRLEVTEEGLVSDWAVSGLISSSQADLVYEGGLVFATSGELIDPSVPRLLGTYVLQYVTTSFVRRVAPEWRSNRTYFVVGSNQSHPAHIVAFDRSTFAEIGRVSIGHHAAPHGRLVRWSADGFAFLAGGDLVIVESNLGARVP
jgi:hypothetical protein